MTGVLRNRAFRWLAAIYALETLIEWFGGVAAMALVYGATGSTTAAAGMLVVKQVIPGSLVPLVASRLDRRAVGPALAAVFAVEAASLVAIGAIGYGVALYPLAFISGAAGAMLRSIVRTGIARTLSDDALRAGNSVTNLSMAVAGLVGPGAAALVVSFAGATAALLAVGAIALACAAAVTLMPRIGAVEQREQVDEADSIAVRSQDPAGGLSLKWVLGLSAFTVCLFAMNEPALLAYSEHALDAGVRGYGAIFVAWGVGLTIGGLVFARSNGGSMQAMAAISAIATSLAYVAMGLSPTIVVACVAAVFGGAGNGVGCVAMMTAIQEATPRGQEARAATQFECIALVAPGIGILVGGFLADLASPRVTLYGPGLLVFAALMGAVLYVRLRDSPAQLFTPSIPGGSA